MSRTVCRREMRVGRFRGSTVVVSRLDELPNASETASILNALLKDPGVARAELWRGIELDNMPVAEEERLRGGDLKINGCLVVETLHQREAENIASDLSRQLSGAETGLYRLLCEIGNGEI